MTQLATTNQSERIMEVLVAGNLSVLTPPERLDYYNRVCESLQLNPLTQPFAFITLNGKLTLYALKGCTDQLRQIHGVSISEPHVGQVGDLYTVSVTAQDKNGRQDADIGIVNVKGLSGENLANAMLKAVTKAKRRVTLSLCGLGMLDETEIEDIPAASKRPPVVMPQPRIAARVDTETSEIVNAATAASQEPTEPPEWSAEEFNALLHERVLTMKDLAPAIGAVSRDNWRSAVDTWLLSNPGKGIHDLIDTAGPPPDQPPTEQPEMALTK